MNEKYPHQDWPFTIYFEDVVLPRQALSLDVAATVFHPIEPNEEELVWFWRFTICVGALRSDDARTVLIHSMNLLAKLLRHEEAVIAKRREAAQDEDPYIVYDQWVESLKMMIQAAQSKEHCFWIAGYVDDCDFLKQWRRQSLLPASHPDYKPPPHIHSLNLEVEDARRKLSKAERVFETRTNKREKLARKK